MQLPSLHWNSPALQSVTASTYSSFTNDKWRENTSSKPHTNSPLSTFYDFLKHAGRTEVSWKKSTLFKLWGCWDCYPLCSCYFGNKPLTVAGQFIWMITTVICAITPEVVTNAAAVHAAPVAFLTESIGCEGGPADLAQAQRGFFFKHLLQLLIH